MAVLVTQETGKGVTSEYAATNTNFIKDNVFVDNKYVSKFSCNINYKKTKFLLNENGDRVALIEDPKDQDMQYITIDEASFNAAFAKLPDPNMPIGLIIADLIDEFIRLDLIRRKIIVVPGA